jgi:hypothetical protein
MQFFKGARIEESPCEKRKKKRYDENSHVPLLLVKVLRN